jgi:hypothetical protein
MADQSKDSIKQEERLKEDLAHMQELHLKASLALGFDFDPNA